MATLVYFFFSSRRRHTRCLSDWSSDVCSSDLELPRFPARELHLADHPVVLDLGRRRQLGTEEALQPRVLDLQREIGRASCRERAQISVGAEARKKEEGKDDGGKELRENRRHEV